MRSGPQLISERVIVIFLLDTKVQMLLEGIGSGEKLHSQFRRTSQGLSGIRKGTTHTLRVFTKYRGLDICYENRVGNYFLPRTRNWLGAALRSSSISMFCKILQSVYWSLITDPCVSYAYSML